MISVKIQAMEHSLSGLENQLREYKNIIEASRRAISNLSDQKGLAEQMTALRAKLRKMEEQAESLKQMILVLGRVIQLYQRNETSLVASADTTLAVNKRLRSGIIQIDSGFVDRLGLKIGG